MLFRSISCMVYKEAKDFSIYLNDRSKARKCNRCHSKKVVNERKIKNQKELEAKRESYKDTPVCRNLDKEARSKEAQEIRRKIEEKRLELEIKKLTGDL